MNRLPHTMNTPRLLRLSRLVVSIPSMAAFSPLALAHAGHGLGDGAHWHPTDTWGWALALAVVAAAVWLARRK
jgi:hypothetical protein